MKKIINKLFNGLNITWPKLVLFSIIMGVYTAIMAMCVPDGNSFHDIAVTPEWWVLPAIIIITNSKKPIEAALKTFVFFLISQPLVYLIQVPFNSMGWGLFGYYPYWFSITILTFPAAFIGWFIKKDKWYSGVILSAITALLAFLGVGYIQAFIKTPPNHLITIIYCFTVIPVLIFAIFKDKIPRIIAAIVTIVVVLCCAPSTFVQPYEAYNNTFIAENSITFVGEPFISFWSGDGEGEVTIIQYDGGYNFKLSGIKGNTYHFAISDDENEYYFDYHYDDNLDSVVIIYNHTSQR